MNLNTEPDAIDLLEEALVMARDGDPAIWAEWEGRVNWFLRMETMRADEERLREY